MHIHVFLSAPISTDTDVDFVWQTLENPSPYPSATLDAASRRISLLYQNVIFDTDESESEVDPTTSLTWSPSPAQNTTGIRLSEPHGTYETQDTGTSIAYSDASSIARFPHFTFSLHTVTALSSLYQAAQSGKGSRKVNMLLAAIEVQGPDTIRVKKGPDVGHDVSILKLILGDDQGSVCKLTAWRDTADAWGGISRGDILYLENVAATWESGCTVTLTASPYNRPSTEICYRTMPYTHQDNRFRPDLRLGQSDAAVSRVAALVRWFEDMAGLPSV